MRYGYLFKKWQKGGSVMEYVLPLGLLVVVAVFVVLFFVKQNKEKKV